MKKDKPSKKKVKHENSESNIINEIQRLYEVFKEDITRLERKLQELDTLIPETTRRQKLNSLLNLFVSVGKVSLLITKGFLRFPFLLPLTQEGKENILQQLRRVRFSSWMFNIILQHTPNAPWEKIDKYLVPALEKSSKNNPQESEDIMVFYFLDRLDIIPEGDKKEKFWELGTNYLKKNVFKKVYKGKEPPEVGTIIDSLKKGFKRMVRKEQSAFSVHGIEPKEEDITAQELAVLKAISGNLLKEDIDLASKQEQVRKLSEAFKLLTPKQQKAAQV